MYTSLKLFPFRSSRHEVFCRKGVIRSFAKFTGKTCTRVSFLIKLQAWACNFIKKETPAQVFSCEFCEITKNTFFTEHLLATISAVWNILRCFWSNAIKVCTKYRVLIFCCRYAAQLVMIFSTRYSRVITQQSSHMVVNRQVNLLWCTVWRNKMV